MSGHHHSHSVDCTHGHSTLEGGNGVRNLAPALTHDDPWGNPFICCDMDHAASSSAGPSSASPVIAPTPTGSAFAPSLLPSALSSTTTTPHGLGTCESADCTEQVECCVDPSCAPSNGCDHTSGTECQDCGLEELEAWACTKEGCHAIQQYLECCSQLDCNLPTHPGPPGHDHVAQHQHQHHHQHQQQASGVQTPHNTPVFTDPNNAWNSTNFTPNSITSPISQLPQAMATVPAPMLPTHVCHWQNCHRIFTSMPDLLGHVATDHLGAPGFLNDQQSQQGSTQQQQLPPQPQQQQMIFPPMPPQQPQVQPTMVPDAMQSFTSVPATTSMSDPLTNAFAPFDNLAGQELLNCLWDDCLPLPECTAPAPDACPTHSHMPNHPIGGHTHTSASGEPFSPQTMLRHVLEEHLGVPGSILGWDAQIPPSTSASVEQAHGRLHAHQHTQLPTPSSTHQSPSPPPVKQLICMWPGCTNPTPFPDAATLMAHLSDCHVGKGKDSYMCHWDGCDRMFRSRQKVLRHLQSHTGHRPFVCPVCEQAFGEASPLAAHMRRHAQEKPFKCEYPGCGKTFAISSSLTIHMRTHNGEKPFVCPHCDKGFVEASNLTKHIRTHTGERPFACSFPGCDKRFPRPDQLKRHMGVHDNGTVKGRRGSKAKTAVTGQA